VSAARAGLDQQDDGLSSHTGGEPVDQEQLADDGVSHAHDQHGVSTGVPWR